MFKKEYTEILNQTVVPSISSPEEVMAILHPLKVLLETHLPTRLYKFRACIERNFDSLLNNYLWFSSPESMNDSFDSRCFFDQTVVQQWVTENQSIDPEEFYKKFFNSEELVETIFKEYPEIPSEYERIKNLPETVIKDKIRAMLPILRDESNDAINSAFSLVQQSLRICSFSELNDSPAMWGLYADNETGFCLGYKFEAPAMSIKTNNQTEQIMMLPVIYEKNRYRVSPEYIKYLISYQLFYNTLQRNGYYQNFPENASNILTKIICPDILMPTKIAVHKSVEWEQEAEWRVFCTSFGNMNLQQKHIPIQYAPSELYLGRRISSINERILIDLAKDQNLPVYKMYLDDEKPSYKLVCKDN